MKRLVPLVRAWAISAAFTFAAIALVAGWLSDGYQTLIVWAVAMPCFVAGVCIWWDGLG